MSRKIPSLLKFDFDMRIVGGGMIIFLIALAVYTGINNSDTETYNVTIYEKGTLPTYGMDNYIETDLGRFWIDQRSLFNELVLYEKYQIRCHSDRTVIEIVPDGVS